MMSPGKQTPSNRTPSNLELQIRWLVAMGGRIDGEALVLPEPLSLWGGLDPATGEIIDRRHPCSGALVSGRVLVLPAGRGSSSASSILLESVRQATAPAAILTQETDGILALGAAVAREIYGRTPAVGVVLNDRNLAIENGQELHFEVPDTVDR